MERKDGGPAYPGPTEYGYDGRPIGGNPGMGLREYFAAKAMAALIIAHRDALSPSSTVDSAYSYADAMLRAREGGI